MLDRLGDLLDSIRGMFVNIPLENTLSYVYVILNILLNFVSPFFSQDE